MYMNIKTKEIMPLICSLRKYRFECCDKVERTKWTQKEFVKGVCSRKTYYSIEKGLVVPKEHIVDSFLKKLDEKFLYVPELDECIEKYARKILRDIDFYHMQHVKKNIKKLIQVLTPYKDYIYYKELLFIIRSLEKFYVESTFMNEQEFHFFCNIYNCFNKEIEELGKDIIFKYLHTIIETEETYRKQVLQLKLEQSHSITNRMNLYLFHSFFDSDKLLLETYKDLEKELLRKKNYIRCLDLHTLYLNALNVFAYDAVQEEFEEVYQKAKKITHKIKNEQKIAQFYLNTGLLYVSLDKYEEANQCILKCLHVKSFYQKYAFILCYYCCQKLNQLQDYPWEMMLEEIDITMHYSDKLDAAFQFFCLLIQKEDPVVVQNYLIQQVLKFIKKTDKTYIKIFKYELNLLIQQTHKYIDLHKFCQHIGEV